MQSQIFWNLIVKSIWKANRKTTRDLKESRGSKRFLKLLRMLKTSRNLNEALAVIKFSFSFQYKQKEKPSKPSQV